MRKRVFSGIQPSGNIHIGNYVGAIRRWVAMQYDFDCLFCIVDLHAVTVPQDPRLLKEKTREVAGILLAAGIDPNTSTLFVQSDMGAHAELAWMLNCLIPMGWMMRMTQFKEKSEQERGVVTVGLFDYPALMAADILLYDTDLVPVGEDQVQHVELARDTAARFNAIYGDTFKLPQSMIGESGARIMGLDDPTRKMSKSEPQSGHAINLLDSPDAIRAKIMRATTDSSREIRFDSSRPGIYNLLTIFQVLSGMDKEEIEARFEGKGYAELKSELADLTIESLAPLQQCYRDLVSQPGYVDSILDSGAERVRPVAESKLAAVKEKMGLG